MQLLVFKTGAFAIKGGLKMEGSPPNKRGHDFTGGEPLLARPRTEEAPSCRVTVVKTSEGYCYPLSGDYFGEWWKKFRVIHDVAEDLPGGEGEPLPLPGVTFEMMDVLEDFMKQAHFEGIENTLRRLPKLNDDSPNDENFIKLILVVTFLGEVDDASPIEAALEKEARRRLGYYNRVPGDLTGDVIQEWRKITGLSIWRRMDIRLHPRYLELLRNARQRDKWRNIRVPVNAILPTAQIEQRS